jgi:hypothetical protein
MNVKRTCVLGILLAGGPERAQQALEHLKASREIIELRFTPHRLGRRIWAKELTYYHAHPFGFESIYENTICGDFMPEGVTEIRVYTPLIP